MLLKTSIHHVCPSLTCKCRRCLLSRWACPPPVSSKARGSTGFSHPAPGQGFAATALLLPLDMLQSPPPECSRFGLCSPVHEQLSGQPAANFRWCEGRAGNISGIHCREMLKLYLGLWQRRDVTAERRWMEPLQSSAHFCSESSASAAEGLPEHTWWGKNFHVILGHARDSLVVTVLWFECARRETNDSNLSSLSSLWHKGMKCIKVLRDAWSPK